ncbi:MAG: 50S ribosomal protein L15 [bacterium]
MKYNEFDITKHKRGDRVGRGIAAGKGKTAGRGTKGQKSRTGSKKKPGFSGGQTPLMQKLPKLHGFRSYRTKSEVVYTGQLEELKGTTVDTHVLAENGLISSPFVITKLILNGDLKKKLTVTLQSASASSIAAIEAAGGKFVKIEQVKRPKTSVKEDKPTKTTAK